MGTVTRPSSAATPRRAGIEHYLELLREDGGRITAGRRSIVTAFLQAGGHVTAEELAATVQIAHPDIALSTVYRTMETLQELGAVEHVHLGHGAAVYHVSGEGHHHLVCEECGRVVEVPDALFAAFATRIDEEFGFRVEARHFALPGRCDRC